MCGVFREGRMPSRKIPPAPRTRCNAPGAKAGCAFFAPGFFAQAKKGGSRRHGAKAFDLCVAARQEGEQEQLAALAPPHPALRATFSRKREKGCLIRGSGLRATSLRPRPCAARRAFRRSEERTSELQSLMRISYADFCLTKKKTYPNTPH